MREATALGLGAGRGRGLLGFALCCVTLLGVAPCSRPMGETQSHGGPIADQVSFIDHLRRQGYTVEIAGEVTQPFLRVKGTVLRLRGGRLQEPAELQAFDYADAGAAAADAGQIGPGGSPNTAQIDWMGPPHFFRRGRLLVLYVGSEPQVVELLTSLLGPQFAGK